MGTDLTDLQDVEQLLTAADQGAAHVRLDEELEQLVARALESGDRGQLRSASLGCRIYERHYRAKKQPIPPRLVGLLRDVRAALRAGGSR